MPALLTTTSIRPVRAEDAIDSGGDRGGVGDVDLERDHTAEIGRHRGEGLGVDVGNGDGRPGLARRTG